MERAGVGRGVEEVGMGLVRETGSASTEAFHVMTKPIGPICNLDCKYCYYLEKERLYPAGENFRMRDEVLEAYIRQYIEGQGSAPEVHFAWQGGEPTLMGVAFFRRVVELQKKYGAGRVIRNALQTNGTLLNDEWGEFFAENGFLVGLSIDGPARLHDAYRLTKRGGGSYEKVLGGLRVLKKHGVEFNTLTVVNKLNSQRPREVYRFLRDIGSGYIQFIPLVERVPDREATGLGLGLAMPPGVDGADGGMRLPVTEWSVEPRQYGKFLCEVFDEWVERDVGRVFVQIFDVTLSNWVGAGGGLCVFSETCGRALAMEHNGDVYSCDHYVYPKYKLGNILNRSLTEMVGSEEQRAFGEAKKGTLPGYCLRCDVRHLCHGECPKHRFLRTPDGEPGLNYLCAAYKAFFTHSRPLMLEMMRLLMAGRAPADVMRMGLRR